MKAFVAYFDHLRVVITNEAASVAGYCTVLEILGSEVDLSFTYSKFTEFDSGYRCFELVPQSERL